MPDLLEQPPSANATPTLPERKPVFRFTRANARQMADKGREARRQREAQLRQTVETLVANPEVAYQAKRLARVRVQLDRLDDELQRCSFADSKRVKELTDAQLRLSEQERVLSGRPLPGSRRPREDRARVSAGWIELQPALPVGPVGPAPPVAPARPIGSEYDDPPGLVRDAEGKPVAPPSAPV
jgi:hypothetical protein